MSDGHDGVVRVVAGTGTGPTELAAYDDALRAAGVHDYNVVTVSSVLPADATLREVDAPPDLGAAGGRLTAVQARATTTAGPAVAGLGWATGPGAGIVYEATGERAATVRAELDAGLDAGTGMRDRPFTDRGERLATVDPGGAAAGCAVVLAVYGDADPVWGR
jgi:arginine decarboxylase